MKHRKVTIKDFEAAKVLQDAKVSTKNAGIALGKSRDTIRRMYAEIDWDGYQKSLEVIKERMREKKTPRVTEEQSAQPSTTPSISSNLQDTYNENLGIIAEKMDKNTEALEKLTIAIYSLRKSMGMPTGEGNKRWTFGSPFKGDK